MQTYYLRKADENLPELKREKIVPEVDSAVLGTGDTFVVDIGDHYVGYFSFVMRRLEEYIDAPVRLSVSFCEVKRELELDFSDCRGGLCASWLQEEIINIDFPCEYKMPRRYAARYIKIKVLAAPRKFLLTDFVFEAVTSADESKLTPYVTEDAELEAIDRVAAKTLKNCMQRVFEDGPKRDRRLWIGDLRLEALTNYYTFGNFDLVRRCLYLFAAAEPNESGILPGYVYEYPDFYSGEWFLTDYSLMLVCTLCDYYSHSKDEDTFFDIYPVARAVLDSIDAARDSDGLISPACGSVFVDWCRGLEKTSALQGIYLYTLELWCATLEELGRADEAAVFRARLSDGREACRRHLYDEKRGAFVNARDKFQYSVHTAVWMTLGGVVYGDEARRILTDAICSEDSVKPFTPYMQHYVTEALFRAGLAEEAEKHIRSIWGGMIRLGADTFFEAYDPSDPDFSPYGDFKLNSMCHAWSCTPSYFIRRYGLGKKRQKTQIKVDI